MRDTANSRTIRAKRAGRITDITFQETATNGPLIKTINRCPATILAANRTERVIGRMTLLINSISTINGVSG